MPVKAEEEAHAKTASAEQGAKKEMEGGGTAAEKANAQASPPPGLDAAFKGLIATLLHKQLNSIKLELREMQAAAAQASSSAAAAHAHAPSVAPSGVAALLGETS